MNTAAWTLTAAGYEGEGRAYGRRGVAWFRSKMEHEALTQDDEGTYLYALRFAEMWQDCADYARQLMSREGKDAIGFLAMGCLGVATAHLGDRAAAEDIIAELDARQKYGVAADVAVALGELDRAVDYLKRSMTQESGYSVLTPMNPELRGYPPYEELFKQQE